MPIFFMLSAYCKIGNHKKVLSIYKEMKKANYFKFKARLIQANIILLLTYNEMGDYSSYSKSY